MFGDKDKLKQVMVNLILNAIKYTEDGKIEVLVEEDQKNAKSDSKRHWNWYS